MATVVIDAATRDRILAAATIGEVELRDESGTLIARVVRPAKPLNLPPGYEIEGYWPSDEERDRICREGRAFTPEQVMERLRSLRGKA